MPSKFLSNYQIYDGTRFPIDSFSFSGPTFDLVHPRHKNITNLKNAMLEARPVQEEGQRGTALFIGCQHDGQKQTTILGTAIFWGECAAIESNLPAGT